MHSLDVLAGFSHEKMYGYFAETTPGSRNNEMTIMYQSIPKPPIHPGQSLGI